MPDIFQSIDQLDTDKKEIVATRLEARATMPVFSRIRDSYFERLGVLSEASIHELGCGTGAVCRAIAGDPAFAGRISGSDLSASLIERARDLAEEAGLSDIEFFQADGQGSNAHDGAYDLVLAHTVISHVADPSALMAEMMRLTRPGGRLLIHDGDYASLTYGSGRPDLDRRMPERYMKAIVESPHVMRELPGLFKSLGLEIEDAFGDVVVEIGDGTYFPSLAENYGPVAVAAAVAGEADVRAWNETIAAACEAGTFFGACNFMTYSARVPG